MGNKVNKQVIDRQSANNITGDESNEQQRKWDEKKWGKKHNDSEANYDITRRHLNFEVSKGGRIQEIDQSKSIMEKFNDILKARGIKNPNDRPNPKRQQRIIAQFQFGGSTENMRKLAFGNQDVDFSKTKDNSWVTRDEGIEHWAVDVYNFVARRFGEDNIVSFYVHLDEQNPHVHCAVIPMNEEKKRISWKSKFGDSIEDGDKVLKELHDSLVKEVNAKYGLERGDSVKLTGAKHRSTAQYKIDLVNEVHELEKEKLSLQEQADVLRRELKQTRTAVRGLTTMLNNLNTKRDNIQQEIELADERFENGSLSQEEFNILVNQLHLRLEELDKSIEDRKNKLEEQEKKLEQKQEDLVKIKQMLYKESSNYIEFHKQRTEEDMKYQPKHEQILKSIAYEQLFSEVKNTWSPMMSSWQMEHIESNAPTSIELLDNADEILNCALLLMQGYVSAATEMYQSGGGGVTSDLPWRDDDDDDLRWARKCFGAAVKMSRKSSGQSSVKSRGKSR